MGVLFRNALRNAVPSSTISSDSFGIFDQRRDISRAIGRSAPVVSIPLPTIIRAEMATSASCPKPWKKAAGDNVACSVFVGEQLEAQHQRDQHQQA